jgi:hypothetical protein
LNWNPITKKLWVVGNVKRPLSHVRPKPCGPGLAQPINIQLVKVEAPLKNNKKGQQQGSPAAAAAGCYWTFLLTC